MVPNGISNGVSTLAPQGCHKWRGFTVCLFIVLLSVFTWVVHRRLSQYQPLQMAGGHHLTATKVCLTERYQLSAPAHITAEAGWMLTLLAFALASFCPRDSRQLMVCLSRSYHRHRQRIRPSFSYFFFLPPPVPLRAL